jgi:hypothetical protein
MADFVSKNQSTHIAFSLTVAIFMYDVSQTSMRRVQRCQIKLFELYFHIAKQFYFVVSGLKIIGNGNSDNNSESHCAVYIERVG